MIVRIISSWLMVVSLLLCSCGKGSGPVLPPVDTTSTIWGSTVRPNEKEEYPAALARVRAAYGTHQIVRFYISSLPLAWPGWLNKESSAHLSFKMNPADVLNGASDALIKDFFGSLGSTAKIYWTYYHEPEDEIQAGEFTAEQYRRAFDHIITLQKSTNKPNLIPVLCLMTYDLRPESKRNWRDYLPKNVEIISWDGYYRDYMGGDVTKIFEAARDSTALIGKPWAIAETGVNKRMKSGQINEDMPVETRKQLLTALAHDIKTKKPYPVFVCYFDSNPPHDAAYSDWRISIYPEMIKAWNAGRK